MAALWLVREGWQPPLEMSIICHLEGQVPIGAGFKLILGVQITVVVTHRDPGTGLSSRRNRSANINCHVFRSVSCAICRVPSVRSSTTPCCEATSPKIQTSRRFIKGTSCMLWCHPESGTYRTQQGTARLGLIHFSVCVLVSVALTLLSVC